MQFQTESKDVITCQFHLHKPISHIYCKQDCPYPSRMICRTCISELKTNDGFIKIKEVLKDPRVIMNLLNTSERGIYNKLNDYFDLLDQNSDALLASFKEGILEHIKKLEGDMKEGIENYNQFRKEIVKVKHQFDEALGFTKFRDSFKNILQADSGPFGPTRCELEKFVSNFILQFKNQNNQDLQVSYQNILEMEFKTSWANNNVFSDFQKNTMKSLELLMSHLQNMGILQKHQLSQLCDAKYCFELTQRIRNNQKKQPKITLLFKGSEHGMTAEAFWGKCSNQGPTLTICKSKNGYVFGGYSPCKWIPGENNYQKDDSQTSFLFSQQRNEIYPILQAESAIYCCSTYGPAFGGNHNLYIGQDFQSGGSIMDGRFYKMNHYISDTQFNTFLMGNTTPQLVEMEVFLIE